jgi:hypothetical protein
MNQGVSRRLGLRSSLQDQAEEDQGCHQAHSFLMAAPGQESYQCWVMLARVGEGDMHPATWQRPDPTGANEEMAAQPTHCVVRPTGLCHHLAAEEADEAVTVEEQPDMGFDGVMVRVAEGVQVQ